MPDFANCREIRTASKRSSSRSLRRYAALSSARVASSSGAILEYLLEDFHRPPDVGGLPLPVACVSFHKRTKGVAVSQHAPEVHVAGILRRSCSQAGSRGWLLPAPLHTLCPASKSNPDFANCPPVRPADPDPLVSPAPIPRTTATPWSRSSFPRLASHFLVGTRVSLPVNVSCTHIRIGQFLPHARVVGPLIDEFLVVVQCQRAEASSATAAAAAPFSNCFSLTLVR